MKALKLNKEDARVLKSLLMEAARSLRSEIRRTESWELKETLKERRVVLDRLIVDLAEVMAPAAT